MITSYRVSDAADGSEAAKSSLRFTGLHMDKKR